MTNINTPRRRSLLKGAAVAAGAMTAPMIAKAQTGPISMRWQSTWPAKDIFHEYALDYAKKVNDMTGGDLKIEVLPAGSVVPAFGLFEAVPRARWTAVTAFSAITTASKMRWPCGTRAQRSAWTPTWFWHGTSTAVALNC